MRRLLYAALCAVLLSGLAITATASPAGAAGYDVQRQIEEQLRVHPGGRQIGSHAVAYKDGDVALVFPDAAGRVSSERASAPSRGATTGPATATDGSTYGCPYGTFTHW